MASGNITPQSQLGGNLNMSQISQILKNVHNPSLTNTTEGSSILNENNNSSFKKAECENKLNSLVNNNFSFNKLTQKGVSSMVNGFTSPHVSKL